MSRQWMIDYDRPLSEQDKEFLLSRTGHEHLVRHNEERFANGGEEDPGPTVLAQIQELSEKDLNAALKSRSLSTSGKMQDRRDRLAEYVMANEVDGDDDDEDDDGDE